MKRKTVAKVEEDAKKQKIVNPVKEDEILSKLRDHREAFEIESISGLDDLIKEEEESYIILLMRTIQDKTCTAN
jgi:hypothetical protein